MEQKPRNFPGEIRRNDLNWNLGTTLVGGNPEDLVTKSSDAEILHSVLERILKNYGIALDKDTKFLEIGSGNVVFLDYLIQRGVNATGVDVSPNWKQASPQALARIEQLPFADESFNVIFSHGVFDEGVYNQNQDDMMREISRVLKHGGMYVGTTLESISASPMSGLTSVPDLTGNRFKMYRKP